MILNKDICRVHLQAPFLMLHVDNKKLWQLICTVKEEYPKNKTTTKKIKTLNQQPKKLQFV